MGSIGGRYEKIRLTTFTGRAAIWRVAFSPDAKILAEASNDKTVIL
ncbi:MAG: hypothetical protein ACHBN1_00120 [Heteroscytonema crispum UTEX LB 1556]